MLGFLLRIKDSLPDLPAFFGPRRIGAGSVVVRRHISHLSRLPAYAYNPLTLHSMHPRYFLEAGNSSSSRVEFLPVFPARPDLSRAFSYPEK